MKSYFIHVVRRIDLVRSHLKEKYLIRIMIYQNIYSERVATFGPVYASY